jgi:hypothetical protein
MELIYDFSISVSVSKVTQQLIYNYPYAYLDLRAVSNYLFQDTVPEFNLRD